MPQCPSCHSELQDDAPFCAACGADASWWLSRHGNVYGPYNLATVRFILADRRAKLDDAAMIGRHGQWRPLGELLATTEVSGKSLTVPRSTTDTTRTTTHREYRSFSKRTWLISAAAFIVLLIASSMLIVVPPYRSTYCGKNGHDVKADLEVIGVALELYVHEHDGMLPGEGRWAEALSAYISEEAVYMPYVGIDVKEYEIPDDIAGAKPSQWSEPQNVVILRQTDGKVASRISLYGDWTVRTLADAD